MRKLFGTDGIRGVANKYPLTVDVCQNLAKAIATKFCNVENALVVIGKDTRESGDIFEHALAAYFASYGINVELLGVVPTPAVSVLVPKLNATIGIVISASHNPFYDNGIKLFNKYGLKLKDSEEGELEELMETQLEMSRDRIGRISSNTDAVDLYAQKIKDSFNFRDTHFRIVVDSANGAMSKIAPALLKQFGIDVVSICDDPNGRNINDNCGVTHAENISRAVLNYDADIGIAFDGDGDRVILADEKGQIIDGNQMLAALCDDNSTKVASTIMTNFGLEKYLQNRGVELIKTAVGDRYISEYMQNHAEVCVGGEPSGHIIIKSHAMTGDGLFSGLKLIEFWRKSNKKSSVFFNVFTLAPVVNVNLEVKNKNVISLDSVKAVIDSCQRQLSESGKLIVRASGTEQVIRITAEGNDKDQLNDVVQRISRIITEVDK